MRSVEVDHPERGGPVVLGSCLKVVEVPFTLVDIAALLDERQANIASPRSSRMARSQAGQRKVLADTATKSTGGPSSPQSGGEP